MGFTSALPILQLPRRSCSFSKPSLRAKRSNPSCGEESKNGLLRCARNDGGWCGSIHSCHHPRRRVIQRRVGRVRFNPPLRARRRVKAKPPRAIYFPNSRVPNKNLLGLRRISGYITGNPSDLEHRWWPANPNAKRPARTVAARQRAVSCASRFRRQRRMPA